MIVEIIKNFAIGFVLGGLFFLMKLPLPAPAYIPAVFSIFGLTLGYLALDYFVK